MEHNQTRLLVTACSTESNGGFWTPLQKANKMLRNSVDASEAHPPFFACRLTQQCWRWSAYSLLAVWACWGLGCPYSTGSSRTRTRDALLVLKHNLNMPWWSSVSIRKAKWRCNFPEWCDYFWYWTNQSLAFGCAKTVVGSTRTILPRTVGMTKRCSSSFGLFCHSWLRQGGPGMKLSAQYPKPFARELLKFQKKKEFVPWQWLGYSVQFSARYWNHLYKHWKIWRIVG